MDSAIITFLSNAGTAGIVLVLILVGQLVTGREHKRLENENNSLQQALATERQRNADLLVWASTGAKALTALSQVAQERSPSPPGTGGAP